MYTEESSHIHDEGPVGSSFLHMSCRTTRKLDCSPYGIMSCARAHGVILPWYYIIRYPAVPWNSGVRHEYWCQW